MEKAKLTVKKLREMIDELPEQLDHLELTSIPITEEDYKRIQEGEVDVPAYDDVNFYIYKIIPNQPKPRPTMAAIDKLKLDYYDFEEFRTWVVAYHPKLLLNMYNPFSDWPATFTFDAEIPVGNFTHRQDLLLLWRCPLLSVRKYLAEQCGMKTRWYHKLFWTKI